MTLSDRGIYSAYRAETILYPWWRHLELSRQVSHSGHEDGPQSSGSILLYLRLKKCIHTEGGHVKVVMKMDVKQKSFTAKKSEVDLLEPYISG